MCRLLSAPVLSCVMILNSLGWTAAAEDLRVASFQADVTPPIGSPLCFGYVMPAREIVQPLFARGIVILPGNQRPIVLCCVEWVEIMNASHDAWREALAEAAGTTIDRVTVHTTHPHDTPGSDFGASDLLAQVGQGGALESVESDRQAISRTAAALRESLKTARGVNQIGIGSAKVEKVASNRRILGPDGKVKIVRYSSSKDPEAIAAPEGTIDPLVRLVSFWDGEQPVAVLSHYATHPQSYYGEGGVCADFVGLARDALEQSLPAETACVHFCGAGGNVAAGKYNNGESSVRPVLAERLAAGMKAAWDATKKTPVSAADVQWKNRLVSLPLRELVVDEKPRAAVLTNDNASLKERIRAALDISYARRIRGGHKIPVNLLRIGPARVLYLPGELFVEYQLAAQEMRRDDFVAMAAYGDCGPGYIGTEIAYGQGGYETGVVSRTAPEVEAVLMQAMRELLADDVR